MTKPSARSIHPSHLADLDGFDRAILAIVQRDSTVPLRLLAEQVNLSTAAVQRRLKRMQAEGVITGQAATVDPTRVGRANQKPWNSCMPRRPTCSCCCALSTFSAISSARVWRPAKLTSTANWSGASTDRSNLM
jgi:DNA-binding Lrp family transcriptional regulator